MLSHGSRVSDFVAGESEILHKNGKYVYLPTSHPSPTPFIPLPIHHATIVRNSSLEFL